MQADESIYIGLKDITTRPFIVQISPLVLLDINIYLAPYKAYLGYLLVYLLG